MSYAAPGLREDVGGKRWNRRRRAARVRRHRGSLMKRSVSSLRREGFSCGEARRLGAHPRGGHHRWSLSAESSSAQPDDLLGPRRGRPTTSSDLAVNPDHGDFLQPQAARGERAASAAVGLQELLLALTTVVSSPLLFPLHSAGEPRHRLQLLSASKGKWI
jgi:hypothetical protein